MTDPKRWPPEPQAEKHGNPKMSPQKEHQKSAETADVISVSQEHAKEHTGPSLYKDTGMSPLRGRARERRQPSCSLRSNGHSPATRSTSIIPVVQRKGTSQSNAFKDNDSGSPRHAYLVPDIESTCTVEFRDQSLSNTSQCKHVEEQAIEKKLAMSFIVSWKQTSIISLIEAKFVAKHVLLALRVWEGQPEEFAKRSQVTATFLLRAISTALAKGIGTIRGEDDREALNILCRITNGTTVLSRHRQRNGESATKVDSTGLTPSPENLSILLFLESRFGVREMLATL